MKVFVDSYYYCEECGNEIHTDENLEGTICTNCEWNGELSLEEDYDYKCSKCGTFELEEDFKMLCPDCGECWTCYDSGIVEVDVCEDCGKEEFEMVLEYEYMCGSCDYSKILPNQTTITCPNCDSECYYWETENLKCISCRGNVITEEKECPDCK